MVVLLSAVLCAISASCGIIFGMFLASRGVFKALGIATPSFREWIGWFHN